MLGGDSWWVLMPSDERITCDWDDMCEQCRPGAWLQDSVYSELLVEQGTRRDDIEFKAVGNREYKAFAQRIGMPESVTTRSSNNCGNQMEFLSWVAWEEERYDWIWSVGVWMALETKHQENGKSNDKEEFHRILIKHSAKVNQIREVAK